MKVETEKAKPATVSGHWRLVRCKVYAQTISADMGVFEFGSRDSALPSSCPPLYQGCWTAAKPTAAATSHPATRAPTFRTSCRAWYVVSKQIGSHAVSLGWTEHCPICCLISIV
jgi:hypothetical protein